MTSRERVQALLEHRPVDRIPSGLGACETAGLHLLAYETFRDVLGLPPATPRMATFMTNAVAEPDFLEAAGSDAILLSSRLCPSPFWGPAAKDAWRPASFWGRTYEVPASWHFTERPDGGIRWDETGWVCRPGSLYFDEEPATFAALPDTDALDPDEYAPPHDLPESYLRMLETTARELYESTDLALACGETIVDLQVQPGGQVAWWMLMAEDPDRAHEYLRKACDAGLSQLRQLDQAVGKYVEYLDIAHDFGDRRCVTMGPELWRSVYRPHYARLFGEWKRITRMKVNLHSCGAVSEILGDLVDCGIQMLNPLQVSANGMDPRVLKSTYGDRLVFYGGSYDAVSNPPDRPYEAVYGEVKRNIEAFSQGGGYLFAGVHNLPGDIPRHHAQAILDAFRDCRDDPALCRSTPGKEASG